MSANNDAWDAASYARTSEDAWSAFIQSRFTALATGKHTVRPSIRSQMLEQELRMLRKYERVALQCRNALSGAAALPAEILGTIFILAQVGWPAQKTIRNGKACYDMGWIHITHVCNMWRRTALRTPALWTMIPCLRIPPQMLPEFIRRSGNLQLQIYADTGLFGDTLENWLCKPVLKRSELVSISSSNLTEASLALRCLSSGKARLRDLNVDLEINDDDDWLLFEVEDDTYNLTCFPALRRVSLRGVYPDWEGSPPFPPSLTHLTLAINEITAATDVSFRPFAPLFRNALAALPCLTDLTLKNFLPIPPQDPAVADIVFVPLSTPFVVRQLQRLTIECDCLRAYADYWYFWANFVVPQTAVVKITLDVIYPPSVERPVSDCFLPITCVDNSACPILEMTLSYHTVSVRYSESPEETWTRRSDIESYRQPVTSRSVKLISHFNEDRWDDDSAHGSRHVYANIECPDYAGHLPLESLRAMFFAANIMTSYLAEFWVKSFSTARNVQRLSFAYPASFHLLGALSRIADDGHSPALFPELDTLILHGDVDPHRGDDPSLRSSLELELLDVLAARTSCAAPIQSILVSKKLASWGVWGHIDRATTSVSFF